MFGVPTARVRLTATEWQVLGMLARNPGKVVNHRQLLEEMSGLHDAKTNYRRVPLSLIN